MTSWIRQIISPRATDTGAPASKPPSGPLRRRLVITLAIALTPVLFLGALSAVIDAHEAVEARSNELMLVADATVDGVEQSIDEAELLLDIYKPQVGNSQCREVYNEMERHIPALSGLIRFDADGVALCASNGKSGFHSSNPEWHETLKHETPELRTDAFYGAASDDWIFAIFSRVDKPDGSFDGSVSIGLRSLELAGLARTKILPKGVEVAIVDLDGRVFGSKRFSQLNPAWIASAERSGEGKLFVLRRPDRNALDVVIKPIGPANVFAVISRSSPGVWSEFTLQPLSSFGLPLLAFSVALLAAYLAMDGLVLHWLRRLGSTVGMYAAGRYKFRPSRAFAKAPSEIRELARAIEDMATDIDERDTKLKDALAVRDAAVKEIHHRVKNNLQIVTSFLNLQGRQLQDPKAQAAIAAARHRIDALAIVHQTLYQHERLELVSMRPFLNGLIDHLSEALGMAESHIRLEQVYDEIERPADDAIPIALFLVESVTNATKYAFGPEGGTISISLKTEEDNTTRLTVSDDGAGFDAGSVSIRKGLGSRLMSAFARQLGATLTIDSAVGKGCTVTLAMPDQH